MKKILSLVAYDAQPALMVRGVLTPCKRGCVEISFNISIKVAPQVITPVLIRGQVFLFLAIPPLLAWGA